MKFRAGRALATAEQMRESAHLLAELHGEVFVEAPPEVGKLPLVTPETWPGVSCTCSRCEVCSWYRVVSATVAADIERESRGLERPVAREEAGPDAPRWRSVAQALQTFGTSGGRLSRVGAGVWGQLQDAAELARIRKLNLSPAELRELAAAHLGGRGSRQVDRMGRSDAFVEVERAFAVALPQPAREGLSLDEAVQVVLARVVGSWRRQDRLDAYRQTWSRREKAPIPDLAEHFGIEPAAVTRLVRAAMHGLRVELGARGLTPMPDRGSRAHHEAHARREALGRGDG